MPIWGHRKSPPNPGTGINPAHPLAQGLIYFAPLWEGAGTAVGDVAGAAGGFNLTLASGASWGSGLYPGLNCNSTTSYAEAAIPAALQPALPVSIAMGFRTLGTPGINSAILGGIFYSSTFANPFESLAFIMDASLTNVALAITLAGARAIVGDAAIANGNDYVMSASASTSVQTLYKNGVRAASGTNAGAIGYGTTPTLGVGGASQTGGRNPNILVYWMGLWNRSLSAQEHSALAANPWAIFAPPRSYWLYHAAAATGGPWPWFLDQSHSGGFSELGI